MKRHWISCLEDKLDEKEITTYETIESIDGYRDLKTNYDHQEIITPILDEYSKSGRSFDQSIINEIVLWKVNRYASLNAEGSDALTLINKIPHDSKERNKNLTADALTALLKCKGIRLPMATTILRFRNPQIYQLIDQRVYRFLGYPGTIPTGKTGNKIKAQIDIYEDYLETLETACDKLGVNFDVSDRIFYLADKGENKGINLNGSPKDKKTKSNS